MKNYKKVYAVREIESGEILTRYTKNGFYSRRADAQNRADDANSYYVKRDLPPHYEVVESVIDWKVSP